MVKRNLFLLVVVILLVGSSGTVLAKVDPYIEDPEAEWGDIGSPTPATWDADAAVGLFGLVDGEDVDAFAYTFADPYDKWPLEVLVPACGKHFETFYPAVALIGPGLPEPEPGVLPFELKAGIGANIYLQEPLARRAVSTENMMGLKAYTRASYFIDIPEAGEYLIAVWSPDGQRGAYALATGSEHDQFALRPEAERTVAYRALERGSWMGVDCRAKTALKSCPATEGQLDAASVPEAPERAKVGEGFVLSGQVVDSTNCQPITTARITFWLVNEQGEYDDDHRGTFSPDAKGAYRIESNWPEQYGPPPHIHLQVTAPGYQTLVTEYVLTAAQTKGEFLLSIPPAQ